MTEPDEKIWRPIPGYEGRYSISTHGRVMSYRSPSKPGKLLKMWWVDDTFRLYLSLRGRKQNVSLRDLVLATFVGPRPPGSIVRHLDGNRANCRLDNICYGPNTPSLPIGPIDPETRTATFTQLTADDARAIAASRDRAKDLAIRYGVTKSMVESIRYGRSWHQETESYRQTTYRRINAKLTEYDVRAILASHDESIDLAEQYGVHRSTINQIRSGAAWRDVARPADDESPKPVRLNPAAKITPSEAREITGNTERALDLAERYGIKKNTVDAIRQGRLWEAVTPDCAGSNALSDGQSAVNDVSMAPNG